MMVDTSHQIYSSDAALGGITLKDVPLQYRKESFIAMDPPRHDEQRKIVSPIVAPPNLAKMSSTIRERAIRILEDLPRGEVFDWVAPHARSVPDRRSTGPATICDRCRPRHKSPSIFARRPNRHSGASHRLRW